MQSLPLGFVHFSCHAICPHCRKVREEDFKPNVSLVHLLSPLYTVGLNSQRSFRDRLQPIVSRLSRARTSSRDDKTVRISPNFADNFRLEVSARFLRTTSTDPRLRWIAKISAGSSRFWRSRSFHWRFRHATHNRVSRSFPVFYEPKRRRFDRLESSFQSWQSPRKATWGQTVCNFQSRYLIKACKLARVPVV